MYCIKSHKKGWFYLLISFRVNTRAQARFGSHKYFSAIRVKANINIIPHREVHNSIRIRRSSRGIVFGCVSRNIMLLIFHDVVHHITWGSRSPTNFIRGDFVPFDCWFERNAPLTHITHPWYWIYLFSLSVYIHQKRINLGKCYFVLHTTWYL